MGVSLGTSVEKVGSAEHSVGSAVAVWRGLLIRVTVAEIMSLGLGLHTTVTVSPPVTVSVSVSVAFSVSVTVEVSVTSLVTVTVTSGAQGVSSAPVVVG